MTPFDFSTAPDRAGSDSIKWRRYAGRDVIPMWVADMDFAAPPPVLEALQARIAHGVFGYADPWPSLVEAVQALDKLCRDLGSRGFWRKKLKGFYFYGGVGRGKSMVMDLFYEMIPWTIKKRRKFITRTAIK